MTVRRRQHDGDTLADQFQAFLEGLADGLAEPWAAVIGVTVAVIVVSTEGSEARIKRVLAVLTAGGLDEAISLANRSRYGLSASLFTKDIASALRYINQIEVGLVRINGDTTGVDPHAPFGGMKESGLGREKFRQFRIAGQSLEDCVVGQGQIMHFHTGIVPGGNIARPRRALIHHPFLAEIHRGIKISDAVQQNASLVGIRRVAGEGLAPENPRFLARAPGHQEGLEAIILDVHAGREQAGPARDVGRERLPPQRQGHGVHRLGRLVPGFAERRVDKNAQRLTPPRLAARKMWPHLSSLVTFARSSLPPLARAAATFT